MSDQLEIKDAYGIDESSFPYIVETNVVVPLKTTSRGVIRCNVYRPKPTNQSSKYPVLVTCGPYGKDIHYKDFHCKSYAEVNPEHHSDHSVWETPDPGFWTKHNYVITQCLVEQAKPSLTWLNGHAGSEFKYLRMIAGRHDLPFYYTEEVEIQKSFLDAFLKGEDRVGWPVKGKLPPVDIVLRKGDVRFNNAEKEKVYERRTENEWPISRTWYTKFFLTPSQSLTQIQPITNHPKKLSYEALGTLDNPKLLQFITAPFDEETEITGHIVAHLNVSLSPHVTGATPSDIDLFLTIRYLSPQGKEVYYTGTAGDPVPLAKGWLRVSLRKTNLNRPKHREYLPWRDYFSTDVQPVVPGDVYAVDVEVWPTNVVAEKGGKIVFEVSSGDTQGSGIFQHNHPEDRSEETFGGHNHLHFGEKFVNYVTLPIVPSK